MKTFGDFLAAFWAWLDLDQLDFLMLAGLLMLWRGLSMWSGEASAWAVSGACLLVFALVGAVRKG